MDNATQSTANEAKVRGFRRRVVYTCCAMVIGMAACTLVMQYML